MLRQEPNEGKIPALYSPPQQTAPAAEQITRRKLSEKTNTADETLAFLESHIALAQTPEEAAQWLTVREKYLAQEEKLKTNSHQHQEFLLRWLSAPFVFGAGMCLELPNFTWVGGIAIGAALNLLAPEFVTKRLNRNKKKEEEK